MQPPNLPLRDPHPISIAYDAGLFVEFNLSGSVCRTSSLLPSQSSGIYKLSENNYAFVDDATPQDAPTWYTIDAVVPFVQCSLAEVDEESLEWAGPPNIRPSLSSPLYGVNHDISISLTCGFDHPSGEIVYEQLKFNVPITFVNVAPHLPPIRTWTPPPAHSPSSTDAVASPTSSSFFHPPGSVSLDPTPVLPVYSQLYDFNGERKIDYSMPLPVYSPRSSTETSVNVCSSTSTSPSSNCHLDLTKVYHDGHDHNVKINTPLLKHASDAVETSV